MPVAASLTTGWMVAMDGCRSPEILRVGSQPLNSAARLASREPRDARPLQGHTGARAIFGEEEVEEQPAGRCETRK